MKWVFGQSPKLDKKNGEEKRLDKITYLLSPKLKSTLTHLFIGF